MQTPLLCVKCDSYTCVLSVMSVSPLKDITVLVASPFFFCQLDQHTCNSVMDKCGLNVKTKQNNKTKASKSRNRITRGYNWLKYKSAWAWQRGGDLAFWRSVWRWCLGAQAFRCWDSGWLLLFRLVWSQFRDSGHSGFPVIPRTSYYQYCWKIVSTKPAPDEGTLNCRLFLTFQYCLT